MLDKIQIASRLNLLYVTLMVNVTLVANVTLMVNVTPVARVYPGVPAGRALFSAGQ